MREWFKNRCETRQALYSQLRKDASLTKSFYKALAILLKSVATGGKILIFGNGGSAAESQHFAAELVCQFEKQRRALPAIALSTDSSILTAQSNDLGFSSVFSRQIDALCNPGDVVIGLTTSDVYRNHSKNIIEAFKMAEKRGAKRIGLFSTRTRILLNSVDVAIVVPNQHTALIQEAHLAIIHMLCEKIEKNIENI